MTQHSPSVVAVVPTTRRPDRLAAALGSIARQTVPPTTTIVVGENPEDWRGEAESTGRMLEVFFLQNHRAPNVSGAINSALEHLIAVELPLEDTYVAFLDDDDAWEPTYLERMLSLARKRNLDLVYSGIIRHEAHGDESRRQSVPGALAVSDFLSTNPHLQGSNIMVRLSTLLRAGGFDERLPSTTDRDLCIRLLDLDDLRYGAVREYLVHHWATDHPRLSSPSSPRKAEGLQAFLDKHGPRMMSTERAKYLERCKTLFDWEPKRALYRPSQRDVVPPPVGDGTIELVIGFTATWLDAAETLLRDLHAFHSRGGGFARLVVCDNSPDPEALSRLIEPLRQSGVPVRLVTQEEISAGADRGSFGAYYKAPERRSGIAYGRTVLHHYLYRESEGMRDAVNWILDDDVRLDRILWGGDGNELSMAGFLDNVRGLKEDGCDVAVGGIFGDPPVPAANLVRTQLVDLASNLRALLNPEFSRSEEEAESMRSVLQETFPDYYYDLSVRHHGHLETPFPLAVPSDRGARVERLKTLLRDAPRLAGGIGLFRPLKPSPEYALKGLSGIPVRGGNTLVFDRECLKTYPNVAPRLGDVDCRRGDTVWCILNARIGGLKAHRRAKRIQAVPLWIRQERKGFDPSDLTLKPVVADIFGGAYMRALDEALGNRLKNLPPGVLPRDALRFSDMEIERILARFGELASRRLALFRMNAWRIRGLVATIRHLLQERLARGDESAKALRDQTGPLEHLLDSLDRTFSVEAERAISVKVTGWPRGELEQFLRDLPLIRSSYSERLLVTADARDIEAAKEFLQDRMGIQHVQRLGEGNEGLVFTDGTHAYKYFHHGASHFEPGHLERIRSALAPDKGWRYVTPLGHVFVEDGRVVFVWRLAEGEAYRGGHLHDFLGLLRECRQNGVVLTNLAPGNLVVGPEGLRYVDLGISVEPFTPASFCQMCKRAYLVYRWHFRKDLKELLTRSLRDDTLAELFGFEHFLASLDSRTVGEVLHSPLLERIRKLGVREVFDYGCGDAHLAAKIAATGVTVVAYDIDESVLPRESVPGITVLRPSELPRVLAEGQRFPCVLSNLVLCTIEDDREVEAVLANLRTLVSRNGRVIVGVCNPFAMGTRESETHLRERTTDRRYGDTFGYRETAKPGTDRRLDVHRPLSKYVRMFRNAALELEEILETPGTDIDALCPDSDFLILVLRPLAVPPPRDVSLLIKASAMEWRTIGMQVRHIVGQLEGPQRFVEKVVVSDDHLGPFARQYDDPDWDAFVRELETLRQEGTIDRFVVALRNADSVRTTFRRWFELEVADPRSENGQPTYTTLFGIEQCRGEYVFQVDSDCLIGRLDRDHDYLGDMLRVFEGDPNAVTVSMPIAYREPRPFTASDAEGKWRTEVRCCLLAKSRLEQMLPLANTVGAGGQLAHPWHRALDEAVGTSAWQSYRGGDPRTLFIHVPNDRKADRDGWYNILKAVERGTLPDCQRGHVDLVGDIEDWVGQRPDDLIFVVRGQNVSVPRLRRCVESLMVQRDSNWGAVFIDAASDNGMEDYLDHVVRRELGTRMTVYRNLSAAAPIENMHVAVRRLCGNPDSIIATVDADDALIRPDVTEILRHEYSQGADVTVGSMLATDKERHYPVTFDDPRRHRGGNVWQHLRTFRKRLFDAIPEDYLKVDDRWVPYAEDWAFMLPIVEMAERPLHITDPLYFYEPSTEKTVRSREDREEMVGAIVSKPSLGG